MWFFLSPFPLSIRTGGPKRVKGKKRTRKRHHPSRLPAADLTGRGARTGLVIFFFYASVGFPHGKGAGPQPHYGILFFFFFLMIRSERWPAAGNGAEARGHFARSSLAPRENCTQTAFGADGVDARALV